MNNHEKKVNEAISLVFNSICEAKGIFFDERIAGENNDEGMEFFDELFRSVESFMSEAFEARFAKEERKINIDGKDLTAIESIEYITRRLFNKRFQ